MEREVSLRKGGLLFLCFVFILSLTLKSELVSAKTQEMRTETRVEIGEYYYEFGEDSLSRNRDPKDIVKISSDRNKKEMLVKQATSWNVVTNGKVLYYSKNKTGRGVIYKMDIKTKKSSKIISGKEYELLGGTDKYLYIAKVRHERWATSAYKVYIYNIKTKKMKLRKFSEPLGLFQVRYKKVLAGGTHSDFSNALLEVMSESGESIFKVQAIDGFFVAGVVAYMQEYYKNNEQNVRYYSYDLATKKKTKTDQYTYEAYQRHSNMY